MLTGCVDFVCLQMVWTLYYYRWCGPCKLLGPRLEMIIAEEKGTVVLAKVDIDENVELAMRYNVSNLRIINHHDNFSTTNLLSVFHPCSVLWCQIFFLSTLRCVSDSFGDQCFQVCVGYTNQYPHTNLKNVSHVTAVLAKM